MSAGIKLYNGNRQVLVDSSTVCFGLSQVHAVTTSTQRPPNVELPPVGVNNAQYGYLKVDNCYMPMIVYELADVSRRIHLYQINSSGNGFELCFFVFSGTQTVNFYIFDVASHCTLNGQSALRIYKSDGELAFDSRLKHLSIVGVANDGVNLDGGKRYGILLRSKPPIEREWREWVSGSRFYVYNADRHQMLWQENNVLRSQLVTTYEHTSWFWRSTGGVRNLYSGLSHTKELSPPLLVDLTAIV